MNSACALALHALLQGRYCCHDLLWGDLRMVLAVLDLPFGISAASLNSQHVLILGCEWRNSACLHVACSCPAPT